MVPFVALHRTPLPEHIATGVICEFGFNIRDAESIRRLFEKHADKIDSVWNLAAPLSVDTAKDPTSAYDITVRLHYIDTSVLLPPLTLSVFPCGVQVAGMERVLTCMQEFNIKKIYFSDSIGSYGIGSPRVDATARWLIEHPEHDPQSDYGNQKKQCRDLLAHYIHTFDFDARFCIIPGVLHTAEVWGGGTTEYALDAMLSAVKGMAYRCPVGEGVCLPMIHATDLIEGMIALMTTPSDAFLPHCRGVALAGFSFTPAELFAELRGYFPDFSFSYDLDGNSQAAAFAMAWPDTLCAEEAERHIGYKARNDFQTTVRDIVSAHKTRLLGGVRNTETIDM